MKLEGSPNTTKTSRFKGCGRHLMRRLEGVALTDLNVNIQGAYPKDPTSSFDSEDLPTNFVKTSPLRNQNLRKSSISSNADSLVSSFESICISGTSTPLGTKAAIFARRTSDLGLISDKQKKIIKRNAKSAQARRNSAESTTKGQTNNNKNVELKKNLKNLRKSGESEANKNSKNLRKMPVSSSTKSKKSPRTPRSTSDPNLARKSNRTRKKSSKANNGKSSSLSQYSNNNQRSVSTLSINSDRDLKSSMSSRGSRGRKKSSKSNRSSVSSTRKSSASSSVYRPRSVSPGADRGQSKSRKRSQTAKPSNNKNVSGQYIDQDKRDPVFPLDIKTQNRRLVTEKQRTQIYALNRLMTRLENERFREFCQEKLNRSGRGQQNGGPGGADAMILKGDECNDGFDMFL